MQHFMAAPSKSAWYFFYHIR